MVKKIVYLFDYYDNKELTKGLGLFKSNFLTENFFHLDHSKLKIYKVEVNEGDCLTIPGGGMLLKVTELLF